MGVNINVNHSHALIDGFDASAPSIIGNGYSGNPQNEGQGGAFIFNESDITHCFTYTRKVDLGNLADVKESFLT